MGRLTRKATRGLSDDALRGICDLCENLRFGAGDGALMMAFLIAVWLILPGPEALYAQLVRACFVVGGAACGLRLLVEGLAGIADSELRWRALDRAGERADRRAVLPEPPVEALGPTFRAPRRPDR